MFKVDHDDSMFVAPDGRGHNPTRWAVQGLLPGEVLHVPSTELALNWRSNSVQAVSRANPERKFITRVMNGVAHIKRVA